MQPSDDFDKTLKGINGSKKMLTGFDGSVQLMTYLDDQKKVSCIRQWWKVTLIGMWNV